MGSFVTASPEETVLPTVIRFSPDSLTGGPSVTRDGRQEEEEAKAKEKGDAEAEQKGYML